jgi:hypothetical protein
MTSCRRKERANAGGLPRWVALRRGLDSLVEIDTSSRRYPTPPLRPRDVSGLLSGTQGSMVEKSVGQIAENRHVEQSGSRAERRPWLVHRLTAV